MNGQLPIHVHFSDEPIPNDHAKAAQAALRSVLILIRLFLRFHPVPQPDDCQNQGDNEQNIDEPA
jgi:hypothetical protein